MLTWNSRRPLPTAWGSMKNISSIKVAIIGLSILAAVWGGWWLYAEWRLSGYELATIPPGEVNLVAISPKAGYKIIVSNQIAYLAEVGVDADTGAMEAGSDSLANAPRLPLKELLQTLQGNEEALGTLIERLNKWNETDIYMDAPVWRAEDIRLALDGDEELQQKLIADLNVDLDGLPLDTINMRAIRAGILIDSPVKLTLQIGAEARNMTARVQELYKPVFCRTVTTRLERKFVQTDPIVTGVYLEVARPIIDDGSGEDVRRSLSNKISSDRLQSLTEKPLQVLQKTVILLNEDFITSASYKSYEAGERHVFSDISLKLTDDGRMRVWKYSRDNPGLQLLFIHDNIAIAAPVIETELIERTVTIRRIPNEGLVQDAVAALKKKNEGR